MILQSNQVLVNIYYTNRLIYIYIFLNKAESLKGPTEPEDNIDYEAKLETENELIMYIPNSLEFIIPQRLFV